MDAEVNYRKALEVNPKSTVSMFNLGNTLTCLLYTSPLVETVVEEPWVEPEPEVEEEKPEKTEPEAMPENIVAVEPEPSEPR